MSLDGFNGRGDELTGRTRLVQEVEHRQYQHEMDRLKDAKRNKMWMQILGGLVLSGFIAGLAAPTYIMKVAHTEEQTKLANEVLIIKTQLSDLIDQFKEMARGQRAPVLPVPPLQLERHR